MKHLIIISLFILSTYCVPAQSTIDVYLTNNPNPSNGTLIETIEETYELAIKEVPPGPFKITKMFDKAGYITLETKFSKTGTKLSETKWEYNQNQKVTNKFHRYFVNMVGWKTEETRLTYNDTSGFIDEVKYIKNGALQTTSKVYCDSLGKPFEVRVVDDKGGFSMIEKFVYSPNANIIRVLQVKPTGQLANRCVYPIDPYKPYQNLQIERQYYPNGEVMLESLEKQTKTDQGYFYDYKYDAQGNWIEKDTYQVTLGKNKKIKNKKLEHRVLRLIKYY